MTLYVGNIYFGLSEDQLKEVFERYGKVESVRIMKDNQTGRSRGFGFVSFENDQEAELAKNELDGAEVGGRNLRVNYATRQK
jgi:RNA recognition motif-containing protein